MLPGARQVEWPGVEGGVAVPDDIKPVQLYSANLFDFGEGMGTHVLATLASKTMTKGAAQLQAAVALDAIQDSNDTAVVEAIEASKNFFFYGLQPTKGLDKLDQVRRRPIGSCVGACVGFSTGGLRRRCRWCCARSLRG